MRKWQQRAGPLGMVAAVGFVVLVGAGAGGCAEEVTIIEERGLLVGLPEAERGGQKIGARAVSTGGLNPGETVSDDQLVRTTPTGERFLVSQSPRHVVVLLRRLLVEGEDALLYNQLISDDTKRRAVMEGHEPTEVLAYLKENRTEVLDLLSAMPMGELSPEVAFDRVDDGSGKDRYRLRVRGSRQRVLEFTQLWVQRERSAAEGERGASHWRFLWVK